MLFLHFLSIFHPLFGAVGDTYGQKAGEAIALGVGAGGGAAGAGAGIGAVFNASIQSKTRQPELRQDIERDQWLGFALTEACFFYGLVGGVIAGFLFSTLIAIAGHTTIASRGAVLITPNVGLMIWVLVVFIVSFLILRRYVFPAIGQVLDRRAASIAEEMHEAAQ